MKEFAVRLITTVFALMGFIWFVSKAVYMLFYMIDKRMIRPDTGKIHKKKIQQ